MGKRANTTKIVGKANRFLILDEIKSNPQSTIEDVVYATGLSRPTVQKFLKEFLLDGIIAEDGFANNESGRNPVQYSLNTRKYFALGVDIDGPPVNFAVADLYGKLLYSFTVEVEIDSTIEKLLDVIVGELEKAMSSVGITKDNVIGIGVGLPASVDFKGQKAVMASRLGCLIDKSIVGMIQERLPVPVRVCNDAHLIGVAEQRSMGLNDDVLCIVHRTGIGLGIIIGGQVYSGASGNAGFIGHMTIDTGAGNCPCGKTGCLEALASKKAIKKAYEERTGKDAGYRAVIEMAGAGDRAAIETLEEAGRYMGIGIANIIKILDIQNVIISDIQCDQDSIFIRSIEKTISEFMKPFFKESVRVRVGSLQDGELALGGCIYMLDKFFESPKLILKTG